MTVLLDRGYRDAIPLMQRVSLEHKMPSLLPRGQRQLTEANMFPVL